MQETIKQVLEITRLDWFGIPPTRTDRPGRSTHAIFGSSGLTRASHCSASDPVALLATRALPPEPIQWRRGVECFSTYAGGAGFDLRFARR